MAIANGVFSYMPPKRFRQMEEDLALIPAFFAQENDIVIVSRDVDKTWIDKMKLCGLKLPLFLKYEDIPKNGISFLRPWGWSPASHFYFKDIYQNTSEEFKNTRNSLWKDEYKNLYSRQTARTVLKSLIENNPSPLFPSIHELAIICSSIEEVEHCLDSIDRVLLKAPWSSAGRGLCLLSPKILTEANRQWISGLLKNQKYLMVEVWKEKVCDLSFQYFVNTKGEISFLGATAFETDAKGNYKGNYIHIDSVWKNDSQLEAFLNNGFLDKLNDSLIEALNKSQIPKDYYGYFGVDCLVYKENDLLKIQPCVEINLRYNMGLLSLKLKEKLHSQARGIVCTEYISDINVFIKDNTYNSPIVMFDNLLLKGFLPLSYSKDKAGFITYVLL